jgi:hypothetical protein
VILLRVCADTIPALVCNHHTYSRTPIRTTTIGTNSIAHYYPLGNQTLFDELMKKEHWRNLHKLNQQSVEAGIQAPLFNLLNVFKWRTTEHVLRAGIDVFFAEMDVTLLRDPSPHLHGTIDNEPVWLQVQTNYFCRLFALPGGHHLLRNRGRKQRPYLKTNAGT